MAKKNIYQQFKDMGAPSKIANMKSWDIFNRFKENEQRFGSGRVATDVTLKEYDKKGTVSFGKNWTKDERKAFIKVQNEHNKEIYGKWGGGLTNKERTHVNRLAKEGKMDEVFRLMKDGGFDQHDRQATMKAYINGDKDAPKNVDKAIAHYNNLLGADPTAQPGFFVWGLMYGQNLTEAEAIKYVRDYQSKTNPNRMDGSPKLFTAI